TKARWLPTIGNSPGASPSSRGRTKMRAWPEPERGVIHMARATDVFLPESRDLPGRIRARRVAEAHFDAELSNDADAILVSMKSYNPLFTTILRDAMRGNKAIFRCNTVDEQREFYRSGREHMNMTQVDILTSIGGDWYGFVHGITYTKALAT